MDEKHDGSDGRVSLSCYCRQHVKYNYPYIYWVAYSPVSFLLPLSFSPSPRDVRERKKNLLRYTPDVARAIAAVLNGVNKRKRMVQGEVVEEDDGGGRGKQPVRPKDAKQAKLYEEMERKWTAAAGGASSSLLGLVGEAEDMFTFDVSMSGGWDLGLTCMLWLG